MSHNFRTFSKEQLFNSIKYCNSSIFVSMILCCYAQRTYHLNTFAVRSIFVRISFASECQHAICSYENASSLE
uniref:Uncharacterized protein n=1 Tax=Anguilla anguilla TaxID=7936 RepID=A0A0E9R2L7_ANGAN